MLELLIWIGKRKGYWITESEWKIVHCLIHYFRCVVSRPFVLQFAKKFFVELLLFKFYRKKCIGVNFVSLFILLFSIIQSIFAVARGPQCCLPFAFLSALLSWLLSPHLFFEFQGVRLIADFITTMSFTHGFFLTERPFFSIYPGQLTRENLSRQFTRYTWPTNIGHFFFCKTWI